MPKISKELQEFKRLLEEDEIELFMEVHSEWLVKKTTFILWDTFNIDG